jgi:hypothetical protein
MGDVLRGLNPVDYRDQEECHAADVSREAFIQWSTSDPEYVNDVEEVGRRWDSA